jgi:hypothetical protein
MRLFLTSIPRYNRNALAQRSHLHVLVLLPLAPCGFWAASCVAPLGPGYTIEKQEIRVQFVSAPDPRIRVEADYRVNNSGNQPLSSLELRLPGHRRFHYADPHASWDGTAVVFNPLQENPRNVLLPLSQPWAVSARHALHLSVEYRPAVVGEATLSFTPAAFFLPAQGWAPELLPPKRLFATGGVPPKEWNLVVRIPDGFVVHTSGKVVKSSRASGELTVRAEQGSEDRYPFVIAGHYTAVQVGNPPEEVHLWTLTTLAPGTVDQASDAFVRTINFYNATFGNRGKNAHPLWIVECPVVAGCLSRLRPAARFLGQGAGEPDSSEMVSLDSMMVDLGGGAPKFAGAAAPSLATSWLGYGQNPGFFEQLFPLAELPAFAASVGREAVDGPAARVETIRRVLRSIPANAEPRAKQGETILRAKSLLFFYALQDRYGREVFRDAIHHMLDARRERGFNLDDLIAAFDQESHRNTAEFVRIWMKRPGVPDEFRARYENAVIEAANSSKETTP